MCLRAEMSPSRVKAGHVSTKFNTPVNSTGASPYKLCLCRRPGASGQRHIGVPTAIVEPTDRATRLELGADIYPSPSVCARSCLAFGRCCVARRSTWRANGYFFWSARLHRPAQQHFFTRIEWKNRILKVRSSMPVSIRCREYILALLE